MLARTKALSPEMKVSENAEWIVGNDPVCSVTRLFPILLLGVVSRSDKLEAVSSAPGASVLDLGVQRPITIHADETLSGAADRMILHARQHRLDEEKLG